MAESSRRKSAYNAFFGVLQQGLTLVLGLIVPQLFIQAYGSAVNGLQSSITNIYSYIALLEAGVGTAALQSLYGPVARGDHQRVNAVFSATHRQYRRVAWIYAACVAVFAVAFPLTVETSLSNLQVSAMVVLSGVTSFLSFFSYGKLLILLQADGRNFVLSAVNIAGYVLLSAARIALIRSGAPVLAQYAAIALTGVGMAAAYAAYRHHRYPWLDERAVPDPSAIAQSRHVLVHHISGILCSSTDVLVLTYVARDLTLVSVYHVYNMVFEALRSLLVNLFGSVDFLLGQAWNSDRERFRRLFPAYESAYITVTFVLYTAAYGLVRPFMGLYTASFTDADYLLGGLPLLFTLAKLLYIARNPMVQLITYAGHFRQTQSRSIAETCINLAVSVLCVLRWGIYGVLLGTIAAMLYRTVDAVLYVSRHLLQENPWGHFRPMLVGWSGFTVCAAVLERLTLQPAGYGGFFLQAIPVTGGVGLFYLLWSLLWNRRATLQAVQLLRRRRL